MLAVIGGSGLSRIPELETAERRIVRTPYGLPSAPLLVGRAGGRDIAFLARHGLNHTLAPHEINYRANIWALHSLGVSGIVAVSAVTSLDAALSVGSLVLPDDLIDYTCGRAATFLKTTPTAWCTPTSPNPTTPPCAEPYSNTSPRKTPPSRPKPFTAAYKGRARPPAPRCAA